MKNEGLVKSYSADGAIAAHRIVKLGSDDVHVAQASAASDSLIGVSDLAVGAAEDRVDVIMSGIAFIEYGGAVTRGAWLTSDANGKAVATTTAGNETIGKAMKSGADGDIGSVEITKGRY